MRYLTFLLLLPAALPAQSADLVLRNTTIYTVNAKAPNAQAVAVKDGKIVYVGSDAGVAKFIGTSTHTIDLRGRFVYPGFVDSHAHLVFAGVLAEIFLEVEPLAGRRHVAITEHRTRKDWAAFVKGMLEERYPQATKVRLVMDNLNTHSIASLYEAFEPEEARRLARRLEIHYTPKHGSWLNVAEIELSALSIQCLNRRIPNIDLMRKEVAAWELDRNNRNAVINWRFTTEDARIKLKRIYPKL